MNNFDPFAIVKEYYAKNRIDKVVYNHILSKQNIVSECINKIYNLSTIKYPIHYIEPSLLIATSELEYDQYSVLYARTIPFCSKEKRIEILIQICAPLILYGLKGTIYAVLAHEFLHYLNILKNIINMNISSDITHNTIFESSILDNEKLIDQSKVFKQDKYLRRLLNIKFRDGFNDERLNKKTNDLWIRKNLPLTKIHIENNFTKLPFEAFSNTTIDSILKQKIIRYEI